MNQSMPVDLERVPLDDLTLPAFPLPSSLGSAANRRSVSIAITRETSGARMPVRLPSPGPISITTSSGAGSSAATILFEQVAIGEKVLAEARHPLSSTRVRSSEGRPPPVKAARSA